MSQDNKALATRFIEEIWNQGNLELIDELVAKDHVDHDPARTGMPDGREGVRGFVEMYRSAFPDVCFAVEDIVAEGDLVVVRWRATGTHQGPLMGMPPSGRTISITGIAIQRIGAGRIVESWANWDVLGLFGQLGMNAGASEPVA